MSVVQIAKDYCEQHHVHKSDNLDKWTTYLKDTIKTNPRQNEELNMPVSIKGIESKFYTS